MDIKPQSPEDDSPPSVKGYELGLEFAISVLVGATLGFFVDKWLGSLPFGLLVGLFLGFSAGMRKIWQFMND